MIYYADTFNRSDRYLNGDTMSDGVGSWYDLFALIGWYAHYIRSNKIVHKYSIDTIGYEISFADLPVDSHNQFMQVQIDSFVGLYNTIQLCICADPASGSGPSFDWNIGENKYTVYYTDGSKLIDTQDLSFTPGDIMKLSCIEGYIRCYVNNVIVAEGADASWSSANLGTYLYTRHVEDTGQEIIMDNFIVGHIEAAESYNLRMLVGAGQ